jgi:hypothetical protein
MEPFPSATANKITVFPQQDMGRFQLHRSASQPLQQRMLQLPGARMESRRTYTRITPGRPRYERLDEMLVVQRVL